MIVKAPSLSASTRWIVGDRFLIDDEIELHLLQPPRGTRHCVTARPIGGDSGVAAGNVRSSAANGDRRRNGPQVTAARCVINFDSGGGSAGAEWLGAIRDAPRSVRWCNRAPFLMPRIARLSQVSESGLSNLPERMEDGARCILPRHDAESGESQPVRRGEAGM